MQFFSASIVFRVAENIIGVLLRVLGTTTIINFHRFHYKIDNPLAWAAIVTHQGWMSNLRNPSIETCPTPNVPNRFRNSTYNFSSGDVGWSTLGCKSALGHMPRMLLQSCSLFVLQKQNFFVVFKLATIVAWRLTALLTLNGDRLLSRLPFDCRSSFFNCLQ